jgi:parvulin-like peptidyl-prolyl isomerase
MKLFSALLWVAGTSLMAQTAPVTLGGGTLPLTPSTNVWSNIPKDKVVLQVNDIKITAGDVDMILKAYPEATRIYALGPGRQQFFDQMVRTLVLNEEGKRRKLDQEPTYKIQAMYSLAAILANQTNTEIKDNVKVDDTVLKKYLEDHQSDYTKLKVRHILIRMKGSPVPVRPGQQDLNEEEALAKAKELQAKIKAGTDFAEIARTESDDVSSGIKGGDLGLIGRGQVVPSFEEAAFKLKAGELSDPVKSQFGFHLIQVQERQVKTFEELKAELDAKVRPELAKKEVDELVNKAKVILAPELLPASKMEK